MVCVFVNAFGVYLDWIAEIAVISGLARDVHYTIGVSRAT